MTTFFDTNVLVYAVDAGDPVRKEIAIDRFARAIKDDSIALSTQVLQEFYNITTRKLKPPLSAREATSQISQLCAFDVIGATADSVLAAAELAQKHRLQWWDALILAREWCELSPAGQSVYGPVPQEVRTWLVDGTPHAWS